MRLLLDAWKTLAAKGEAPADSILLKSYVAEITAAPDDARTIDFTISTGAVDRDRDTIAPEGWKLAAFKKNPTVLWAHDYTMPPIARASKIHVEGNALKATAEFAPAEVYPFAETIFRLLKGGFLKATSVGFRPLTHVFNADRGGMDFATQELLEFSIVPVPANADCLMEGKAAGIDVEPLREWAVKTLDALGATQIVRLGMGEILLPYVQTESVGGTHTTNYSFGWRKASAQTPGVIQVDPKKPDDCPMGDECPMRPKATPAPKTTQGHDDIDLDTLDVPDEYEDITPQMIAAAVGTVVREGVAAGVRRAVTSALGRVD